MRPTCSTSRKRQKLCDRSGEHTLSSIGDTGIHAWPIVRAVEQTFTARCIRAQRPGQFDPIRISRFPAWLAGPTTPSFSMRSISDAARLYPI